ncbi:hypothetical protein, partial [Anaerotignum lactatifermentans]|uniref:hypothetical protein n=1 Tax=Anaerotignum lactatifermentans TaxID=160404 RepID=UPI00307CA21C
GIKKDCLSGGIGQSFFEIWKRKKWSKGVVLWGRTEGQWRKSYKKEAKFLYFSETLAFPLQ